MVNGKKYQHSMLSVINYIVIPLSLININPWSFTISKTWLFLPNLLMHSIY